MILLARKLTAGLAQSLGVLSRVRGMMLRGILARTSSYTASVAIGHARSEFEGSISPLFQHPDHGLQAGPRCLRDLAHGICDQVQRRDQRTVCPSLVSSRPQ